MEQPRSVALDAKIEHILTSCAQKRLRRKLTAALMVGMYTRNPFGDVAVNHDNPDDEFPPG